MEDSRKSPDNEQLEIDRPDGEPVDTALPDTPELVPELCEKTGDRARASMHPEEILEPCDHDMARAAQLIRPERKRHKWGEGIKWDNFKRKGGS